MNKESAKKIGLWNIVGLGIGGAVAIPLFFSFLALKKGSVKKETLDANRQQIVDAALKADR